MKLHHIGVAVKSIEKELPQFESLGYRKISDIFCDEAQRIKGLFIAADHQPTLELLENLTPDGPMTSFLNKGVKFCHFSYETDDIERDRALLEQKSGAVLFVPVMPATYFEKICFMMLPNKMIVELVEIKEK